MRESTQDRADTLRSYVKLGVKTIGQEGWKQDGPLLQELMKAANFDHTLGTGNTAKIFDEKLQSPEQKRVARELIVAASDVLEAYMARALFEKSLTKAQGVTEGYETYDGDFRALFNHNIRSAEERLGAALANGNAAFHNGDRAFLDDKVEHFSLACAEAVKPEGAFTAQLQDAMLKPVVSRGKY